MPTYNRRDRLREVLGPLLADDAVSELVVVVDGSGDGSLELLRELASRHPRLVPVWRENGGENRARQTGLERLTTDVALFLDDDVLAGPGLAAGHAAHHERAEDLVVLGSMPTRLPQPRRPGQFATHLYAREYEGMCRNYESGDVAVLDRFWAGNFSVRRTAALRVGFVADEFSGRYHADNDLGRRFAQAGLTGVFDRALHAQHTHARPLEAFVRDARAQGAGRVLLEQRYGTTTLAADETALLRPLPPALARRVLGRPGLLTGVAAAARWGVRGAGALHLWPVEDAAAKLLRRVEQVRGAQEQRAEAAPAS
ncbi:glycosyltransferase family 2 protein [Blastococcus sp. SYSU D00695]